MQTQKAQTHKIFGPMRADLPHGRSIPTQVDGVGCIDKADVAESWDRWGVRTIMHALIAVWWLGSWMGANHAAGGLLCRTEGKTCKDNQPCCKDLSCRKGRCTAFCRAEGYPCTQGSECCQGLCTESRCGGSCRSTGERCSRDQECCSLKCAEDRCTEGSGALLCDPAECLRWDPTLRLCRSHCENGTRCTLGRCRRLGAAKRSPPRLGTSVESPTHPTTSTNPSQPTHPTTSTNPNQPTHSSTPTPPILRSSPPAIVPSKRSPPPLCRWQDCLHLDKRQNQCTVICPAHTRCDGEGRCLPLRVRCPRTQCLRYDVRQKRCVSLCLESQRCVQGRCVHGQVCLQIRCMRFDARLRRCVSVCPKETRCDGYGRCMPMGSGW